MNFIKVKDGDQVVNLPVENEIISLSLIKTYFAEACGLTYIYNKEVCAVDIIDGHMKLINGMKEYEIFKTISKSNLLNDAKKRKVEEIMAIINKDVNKNEFKDDDEKGETDPRFENFMKKMAYRKVFVGWKHKDTNKTKFLQMKEPWGGIKTLELNKDEKYNYQVILQLAIQEMKNDKNSNIFNSSTFQLGNFHNDVFDNFNDFWKFSKNIRANNRQIRIYILSSSKIVVENKENNVTTEMNQSFVEVEKTENKAASIISNMTAKISKHSKLLRQSNNCNKLQDSDDVTLSGSERNITSAMIVQTTSRCLKLKKGENHNKFQDSNYNIKLSGSLGIVTEDKSHDNCIQYYEDSTGLINKIKIVTSATSEYALNYNKIKNLQISVPVVEVEDLYISTFVLGQGAFGCVKKATWLGRNVAVKRSDLCDNNKYILREIELMDKLRHPNITSIMAVSIDTRFVYIVMELFAGNSLRSALFGKERANYQMSENNKNLIGLQISQAVTFLHERKPPIIHQDIKPENILVNEDFFAKLCDLGLSSTETMPSLLHTTIGSNIRGTPYYMAPEILVKKNQATEKSDVWSLASVYIEMYNEKSLWNDIPGDIEDLQSIMKAEGKPNLSSVPAMLRGIIGLCFEYEPMERPKASILLDLFKCIVKINKM